VNAGSKGAAWSRFYESAVATDHANTILTTAYGRNIQAALRKGHDQAGFRYARFHGILDDDIGVYSEPGGAPTYSWTKLDQVYDAVVAAGMRPMVEVSFMPTAMATSTGQKLASLWYNNMSPNISAPKDWTKWQALMTALVQHLESRYGAAEVRNNWYFEIWNEASWMYAPGPSAYNMLYQNTVAGLLAGDAQLKVGGPADTGGNSPYAIPSLISFAKTNNVKLDFISFHRYGDDNGGTISDANGMLTFNNQMIDLLKSNNFTGELWNTEFGPTYMSQVSRDNESSASFVAKLMHLIGTDPTHAPPNGYGYWALSDLYEEVDTGAARAYREGNYGLLLKGDPAITESFDVPKPAFNAFRVLHLLGSNQLPVTGGSTADAAVNALATIAADGQSVQILVYNHVAGGAADSSTNSLVSLTVNNLPFATSGTLHVRHYMIDRTHSNSYQTWVSQGKPATPTQAQWVSLRDTGELCSYTENATATAGSWTIRWPQNVYGVSLIVLTP
jgi:xylan 1,4-beta-xylosidase